MRLTYANITSTLALFAALTTGTSYAAATLGKDSVRSREIKNGQVTLADLHPSVRKRLGAASKPTTGRPSQGTLLPVGKWADTAALVTKSWSDVPGDDGIANISDKIGTTGNVELRLVGTLTTTATDSAMVCIFTVRANGTEQNGKCAYSPHPREARTYTADELGYGTVTLPAKDAQRIRARYEGKGATSTLRIQVRRIA